jgi:hypothetical protein
MFFHIGKRGGHLSALHLHQKSSYFSRFDVSDFFGNVSKSKLVRALRRIGFSEARAFDFATESVVVNNGRKHLPFGFCQSPLLATLVLEKSLLGVKLKKAAETMLVSVYMDDILISCDDASLLEIVSEAVVVAAQESGFPLSPEKLSLVSTSTDIFNCHMVKDELSIQAERMQSFKAKYYATSEFGKAAIEKYIAAVAPSELARFQALL